MFDSGEELAVDGFRVPWLIWVQILVLFLLILLLYCFSNFDFDLSEDSSAVKTLFRRHSAVSGCFQVEGSRNIKGEVARSSGRGILRIEEAIERGDSTFTDVSLTNIFHPCFYFRLARTAFLKCLGLDSASDCSSSPTEHRKES